MSRHEMTFDLSWANLAKFGQILTNANSTEFDKILVRSNFSKFWSSELNEG